jgi:GT2 family glycosyltransferase
MQSPPFVHVIILNWNHLEDLKLTLDSFLVQDYPNLKIIVADNGSIDGSTEYIKQNYKELEIIENGENLGYAAGNNKAIEWSLNQGADYILLANNDIFFNDRQLISKISDSFLNFSDPDIGIYGIQERNYYLPDKIESEGHFLFEDFSTLEKQFNIVRSTNSNKLTLPLKYVDFVPGSFILIKKEVFKACGLLDEAFFMYHEEAEFCFRAWNNGFTVAINPSICYFHKVGQSSGENSSFGLYYRIRNNFYFLHKHKEQIQFYSFYFRKYSLAVILSFIKLSASLLFRYKINISIWKAFLKAINDVRKHSYYCCSKIQ